MPHPRFRWLILALAPLAAFGCHPATGGVEDGERDPFVASGKTDTPGVSEGEFRARALLRFLNTVEPSDLLALGLSPKVVDNIEWFLSGDDGIAGTQDDGHFDHLDQLDAIPFVGPSVLAVLVDAAMDWLGNDHPTASCSASGWVEEPAPEGAMPSLIWPGGDVVLDGGAKVLRRSEAGTWTSLPLPAALAYGGKAADRLGLYVLSVDGVWDPLRAPRLEFWTNWSTKWSSQLAVSEDEFCAAAPFTCDSDPDAWSVWVEELRLDGRGFVHGLLIARTEDGSRHRALLYVTNHGGAWRLETVAIGRSTGSASSGWWTEGTPQLGKGAERYAALCAAGDGAAVVFGEHPFGGDWAVLTVASAGNGGLTKHQYLGSGGFDAYFGWHARHLACDAAGDRIEIVYETGYTGDTVARVGYSSSQQRFLGDAKVVGAGATLLRREPLISIDDLRGKVHVIGQAVDQQFTSRFYHLSGSITGNAMTLHGEIPLPGAGIVSSYRTDMAVDDRGALHVVRDEAQTNLYSQRCD
jgi:hypothetical protein